MSEDYWYDLVNRIRAALGTAETGDALVEVANNAHRAELELARQKTRHYADQQEDEE